MHNFVPLYKVARQSTKNCKSSCVYNNLLDVYMHKQIFEKGPLEKVKYKNPAFWHNYVPWVTILEGFKIIHRKL